MVKKLVGYTDELLFPLFSFFSYMRSQVSVRSKRGDIRIYKTTLSSDSLISVFLGTKVLRGHDTLLYSLPVLAVVSPIRKANKGFSYQYVGNMKDVTPC